MYKITYLLLMILKDLEEPINQNYGEKKKEKSDLQRKFYKSEWVQTC